MYTRYTLIFMYIIQYILLKVFICRAFMCVSPRTKVRGTPEAFCCLFSRESSETYVVDLWRRCSSIRPHFRRSNVAITRYIRYTRCLGCASMTFAVVPTYCTFPLGQQLRWTLFGLPYRRCLLHRPCKVLFILYIPSLQSYVVPLNVCVTLILLQYYSSGSCYVRTPISLADLAWLAIDLWLVLVAWSWLMMVRRQDHPAVVSLFLAELLAERRRLVGTWPPPWATSNPRQKGPEDNIGWRKKKKKCDRLYDAGVVALWTKHVLLKNMYIYMLSESSLLAPRSISISIDYIICIYVYAYNTVYIPYPPYISICISLRRWKGLAMWATASRPQGRRSSSPSRTPLGLSTSSTRPSRGGTVRTVLLCGGVWVLLSLSHFTAVAFPIFHVYLFTAVPF